MSGAGAPGGLSGAGASADPLVELGEWIDTAAAADLAEPAAAAFVTVGADGAPSARTVTLKRLEPDALLFTTALWTRKARELAAEPQVAALFHWPSLGLQASIEGTAEPAERELAEELWAERDPAHRRQTVVSRQGEPIEDLGEVRARLGEMQAGGTIPECPSDWGAVRLRPLAIELWRASPDRLHERRHFRREGDDWALTLLSP